MKKRIFFILFLAVVFFGGASAAFFSQPKQANAQAFTSFGGYVTSVLPCTCSGNFLLEMSPFFSPAPSVGALVYQPGSTIVYANYVIPTIGVWLLGDYTPAIQACYIVIPFGCMPIPSVGLMHQTGTGGGGF